MCDVDARQAVERLYAAKDMAPTKQLSIMCRNFADVAEYTLGFPAPQPGRPDAFRLARQALPGPVRPRALLAPQSMPHTTRVIDLMLMVSFAQQPCRAVHPHVST